MPDPRHTFGRAAEDAVARWLSGAGWQVLARRERSKDGGEIDILALDEDAILVAVEVRARRSSRAGAAATSVDQARVARLRRTLVVSALHRSNRHRGLRVDLVTVEPAGDGRWRLERLEGIG
jgi:putative endonuclease